MVTAGYHKGKQAKILRVIPDDSQVILEGINVVKKHIKPNQQNQRGSIIQKEMPIHISNVSPVIDGKPVRVRFKTLPDGSKIRVAANKEETQLGQALRKAR